MRPWLARASPAAMRSKVDLPQPLGPTIETKLFSGTSSDVFSIATVESYVFERLSTRSSAAMALFSRAASASASPDREQIFGLEVRFELQRLLRELDRTVDPLV